MYYAFCVFHKDDPDCPWYIGVSKNPQQRLKQLLRTNPAIRREAEIYDERLGGEPQLKILGMASQLKDAEEIRNQYIDRYDARFNKHHNANAAYHKSQQIIWPIYWILEPEVGPDRADELARKIYDELMKAGL